LTAAQTDGSNQMQALKLYRLNNQCYITKKQGLPGLVNKLAASPAP